MLQATHMWKISGQEWMKDAAWSLLPFHLPLCFAWDQTPTTMAPLNKELWSTPCLCWNTCSLLQATPVNIGQNIHKKLSQLFWCWSSGFIFCSAKQFVSSVFMTVLSCSLLHLCAFFPGCKGNRDWGASQGSAPLFSNCCGWCHQFPAFLSSQNLSAGLKEARVVLCSFYGRLGRPLHSQLFLLMQSRCWGCFISSLIKIFFVGPDDQGCSP